MGKGNENIIEKPTSHKEWTELVDYVAELHEKVDLLIDHNSTITRQVFQNIGLTVRIRRFQLGFNQKELAPKLKVTPNYLSLVEHNKRTPSIKLLRKLFCEL